MNARFFFVAVAFLALASSSFASLSIDVNKIDLAPDTISTFTINVTGGDAVQGLSLYLQIGDGGSVNGGTDTTPIITGVDITGTGTIFNGNNTGANPSVSTDLIYAITTTTNSGVVVADGVLAYVTVDTTGAMIGESYDFLLTGVAQNAFGENGVSTDFAGIAASITNGTINIVPEPATLTLLGTAGIGVLLRRKR